MTKLSSGPGPGTLSFLLFFCFALSLQTLEGMGYIKRREELRKGGQTGAQL